MKLSDIIKTTAMYLGRNDVISYLEDTSTTRTATANVLELINNLTRCSNLVINEIASSYIPMYKEENFEVNNGKILFTSFTESVSGIVEVFDEFGVNVSYKVFPEHIEVNESNVKVKYKYLPSNYSIDEEIGYTENIVPSRIIAYGTASEYCLLERSYQESLMWRNRFNDGLSVLLTPKNGLVKNRRFCL